MNLFVHYFVESDNPESKTVAQQFIYNYHGQANNGFFLFTPLAGNDPLNATDTELPITSHLFVSNFFENLDQMGTFVEI